MSQEEHSKTIGGYSDLQKYAAALFCRNITKMRLKQVCVSKICQQPHLVGVWSCPWQSATFCPSGEVAAQSLHPIGLARACQCCASQIQGTFFPIASSWHLDPERMTHKTAAKPGAKALGDRMDRWDKAAGKALSIWLWLCTCHGRFVTFQRDVSLTVFHWAHFS